MGGPGWAAGISSGSICRHCSLSVGTVSRRTPHCLSVRMTISGDAAAGPSRSRPVKGLAFGCSQGSAQHMHMQMPLRSRSLTSATAFTASGSQQSARADTALCFASDTVSDPDPNPEASERSDMESEYESDSGQQTAQGSNSTNYAASGYAAHDLRVLWDSVGRPLLRVGRAGKAVAHNIRVLCAVS